MKKIKQEELLLKIIKFGPILFVLTVSFIFINIMLNDKKENFKSEIQHIEETFLQNNKNRIQDEIREVYDFVSNEKINAENLLKESIKNRVYEAHQIATNIYKGETSFEHNHSDEHVMESIKHALGGIIYNKGRGYIFMDDISGTKLLQPLNKEFEGKNLYNFKDAKGYQFVRKIVQTIKDKTEAYDSYYWYKSGDKVNDYKKISFYKYFEPFNVAIGTGEYVKDFENELKEKVLKKIRNIRYGNKGYIFVYDLEGNCLSHYNKDLIGENRIDYQDKNGKYLVKEVIEFTKNNKEGFLSYLATINPIKDIPTSSKISYLKLFQEWGWVIGTGFYTDTLYSQIEERKKKLEVSNKKSLENIVYFSIVITLIFIGLSFLTSKFIKNRFDDYQKSLEIEIENTIEKEKLLVQQSKMATMGEMLSNIAHQWKQPISVISMSNSLLRMKNESNEDFITQENINESIDNIDNSVKNLIQTIDDFGNFFNPNKQKSLFSIEKAFGETCKLMSSQFKNNNIHIIKTIVDFELYGSQNELQQVLINILKNAKEELIKKDSSMKKLIFINAYIDNNDNKIIEIKDNAGGIPEEIKDKIFDSYFTTKEDTDGTGIGLYMSKQIIEKTMKGNITVSNLNYKYEDIDYIGAEFKICIPNLST